jgi:general secretion pathway protein D
VRVQPKSGGPSFSSLILLPLLFLEAWLAISGTVLFASSVMANEPPPLPLTELTTITQVAIGRVGEQAVARITADHASLPHAQWLNNPDRLVLDFANTHLSLTQTSVASSLRPIREIRLGQFKPDVARVVVDLEAMVPYTIKAEGQSTTVTFAAVDGVSSDTPPSLPAPPKGEQTQPPTSQPAPASLSASGPSAIATLKSPATNAPGPGASSSSELGGPPLAAQASQQSGQSQQQQSTAPSAPAAHSQQTAPASPPLQTETQPDDTAQSGISLNLENADLNQVLRIIGTELKINYIVDPGVKGTVNINTTGTVSRADLFSLLQTILQINGATIIKEGGYYHILPLGSAKQEPLQLERNELGTPLNPEAGLSLLVIPMRFVPAAEMSKILSPFVSSAGQIVVQEQGNLLLVAETTAKLKQFQEIVGTFDSPVFSRERVRLFPIRNNVAKDMVSELQSVFAGYGLSGNTSAIHFVPLEHMNSILAISPSPEVFEDVQSWIDKLDQPSQQIGIQNFVYKVQNAKAADLRDILIELYGGQISRGQATATSTQSPTAVTAPPNPQSAIPGGGVEAGPASETRIQGEIRILSDDKNNALIVQASPRDYTILERTIEELDLLPRQVLIDAKIFEVDLTGALSLGISAFLNQKGNLPGPLTTTGSISAGQAGGVLAFSTFSILSTSRAIQEFINADENRSRVRTLSSPSILVTDNTSARIQVGSEVPVPTGSSLTPVQSNGSSLFAQTIQYLDTGVILTVTPRVNSGGVVTLNVSQEVSAAVPNTTSQIVAPVVNKTAFQTSVVLKDGEVLALGGIITTSDSYSTTRVPLLGDIPGLGLLFGSTSKNTSRKELVLLLTPHVVQDIQQARTTSQELLSQMNQVKAMLDKEKIVINPNP